MSAYRNRVQYIIAGFVSLSFLVSVQAASAQQILSAVESEPDGDFAVDKVFVNSAGSLASTTLGGVDSRAYTDFGVNKVYSSGNATHEQYATSAWLDSYTVGGAAGSMVNLTFNFSIDGVADFSAASDASFNFAVYALRGNGWTMSGYNYDLGSGYGQFAPIAGGDNYERIVLQQLRQSGNISQMDTRDFDGFLNFGPNSGQPGDFYSKVKFVSAGGTSFFSYVEEDGFSVYEYRLLQNVFVLVVDGVAQNPSPYLGPNAWLGQLRASLAANYSMLDMAVMCGGESCASGIYPGTDLSLSFSVEAGSTFSLASIMYIDDLREGTIDLFNTAKMTGISISDDVWLTSSSGTLGLQADGSYGYPAAATGAVPEPATWAMLIAGFAMTGAMMRRRAVRVVMA